MQEVIRYKINGAEIKLAHNGGLIVGFSSQIIIDEQLMALRDIKENYFLAFYNCDLSQCNLKLLVHMGVTQIDIFHASFNDADLMALCESDSLCLVKLHDTRVTQSCINKINEKNPKIKIFFLN
jgi:hypothetical protein